MIPEKLRSGSVPGTPRSDSIPGKLRSDSLLPGTSALPLFQSSLLISNERCLPLLTCNELCIGFVSAINIPLFRNSKYFSYTKIDKTRVLKLKSPHLTEAGLDGFVAELRKKGLISVEGTDPVSVFADRGSQPICRVERGILELLGAKTSRVSVVAFSGKSRNCKILLGKRQPTAMANPAKYQLLLSFDYDRLTVTREELAEIAYRGIELQPDSYGKLKSAGLKTFAKKTASGVSRISTHTYEIDITDSPLFAPKVTQVIEAYETVPIHTVLDKCHAGVVCCHDIPIIVDFCIRHGIITPETDEQFVLVNQTLNYDMHRLYKKEL
ncbi:hypothetical protein PSACC_00478 [Paramicrosporidium saccamoebae]|uniref:Uncharacterized protein n=1 Tax=Paramicrosporidium saccamoebae TaxID=1246581 RepID=A0A2H9TPM5_9FUNG|nr:hypothetical protein PSACC_00478 [Paramicrosporidium saccamoebae]